MRPLRSIVNRTTTNPVAPTLDSQMLVIRRTTVVRYSGQQKSPMFSDTPAPAWPPVDSPNPAPRTPVSAAAVPVVVSAPRVGDFPRASAGASFTGVGAFFN